MTVSSPQKISFEAELEIAKEGFRFAKQYHDNWFDGVNRCPYDPAYPQPYRRNDRAEAWYRGWWFYHHTIKRLQFLWESN